MQVEIDKSLAARLEVERPVLQKILHELRQTLCHSGLESKLDLILGAELAEYSLEIDPVDKSSTLVGVWRDDLGYRRGEVQIREGGGVYAEMDVVLNHPTDQRWFIEAVTAWGNKDSLKTELRLLPAA